MPLSEYEQRVLEELERDLGADPKLGHAMSRGPRSRGRMTWAVLGVMVGLGTVLAGTVAQTPIVGIVGFALMILAALWGMLEPRKPAKGPAGAKGVASKSSPQDPGFMRRVEERFERRREQGDL
ncbi:MAG: hypothetical protein CVT64_08390 [Actinobacteria bacterium HGW-Actinobacteria-4]|nr:MAG: hypothetical protein CVT64_08390 [Actinobacteria bacterium HGW-Actinobacteria-4]